MSKVQAAVSSKSRKTCHPEIQDLLRRQFAGGQHPCTGSRVESVFQAVWTRGLVSYKHRVGNITGRLGVRAARERFWNRTVSPCAHIREYRKESRKYARCQMADVI